MIQYTVALIAEFAQKYGISNKATVNYLTRFKGMEHLEECYGVLHTFSFEDSVDALASVCRTNGGRL